MSNSNKYATLGWILSSILYGTVIIILAYALSSHQSTTKSYTSKPNELLHVSLVERKKNDSQKPKEERKKVDIPKPEEPKPPKESAPETITASSPKEATKSTSLQGLFEKIDTTKLPKAKEQKKEQTKPTRTKNEHNQTKEKSQDMASKIANSLNFAEQKHLIDTKRSGEYDPFIGRVQEILEEHWQRTIDTENGNVAKVTIKVDNKGRFSSKIVSLSYNNTFNTKLKEFLMAMESESFPPYDKGALFEMTVEFKDIME